MHSQNLGLTHSTQLALAGSGAVSCCLYIAECPLLGSSVGYNGCGVAGSRLSAGEIKLWEEL